MSQSAREGGLRTEEGEGQRGWSTGGETGRQNDGGQKARAATGGADRASRWHVSERAGIFFSCHVHDPNGRLGQRRSTANGEGACRPTIFSLQRHPYDRTLVFPVLPVHRSRAASGCWRLSRQAHSHFGAPRRPHHFGPVLPGTLGTACGVGESPHVSHPHWPAAGAPQRSVDRRRRASARRPTGLAPTHSTKPNVPFLLKLKPAETRQG